MSVDQIETPSREQDYSRIPFYNSSEHRLKILVEGRDPDIAGVPVDNGDFVGYQSDGTMVVIRGAPGPTNQPYDGFAEVASRELNMEIGAYLAGKSSNHSDTVTGKELKDLADRVLDAEPELMVSNQLGYHGVAPVDSETT